jgi:hypothetical protein
MEITIREEDVGKEFIEILNKIIEIRKNRRKIYGDGWKDDPLDYEIWQIYGKTKRIMNIFKDGNNYYEKLEDSLIDEINYCFFALAKLSMGDKK